MVEWSVRELIVFGRMVGFPEEALTFMQKVNMDGNDFARLKSPAQVASKGYTGRSDTIWTVLNSLRTAAVHDWLKRSEAFLEKNASERRLEILGPDVEILGWVRMIQGLDAINSLDGPEEPEEPEAEAESPSPTAQRHEPTTAEIADNLEVAWQTAADMTPEFQVTSWLRDHGYPDHGGQSHRPE
eukprot:SAG22_NODE_367_length_11613_cov_11.955011_1_plen_184_part_10